MLKKMQKLLNKNLFCGFLFIFAVLLSVYLKNENTFDLKNYHYYNAFAFLNNRLNYDIVPAYVNTFFNPLTELPLYFYIQWFNCHLDIIFALQGIWFGLLLIAVFKISELFFDFSQKNNWLYLSYILLMVTTCSTVLPQIGSSTNEIMIASIGIWGIYILLYMFKYQNKQRGIFYFLAGAIIGVAVGLKPTFVSTAIASGIMLMVSFKNLKQPVKYITLFTIGGICGGLITNGFMMWKYWNLYGNPFFPFLNGIFKSPYMETINYRDDTYKPKFISYFFTPYIWFADMKYQPCGFRGLSILVYYSFSFGTFFYLLFKRKLKSFYNKEKIYFAVLIFVMVYFYTWFILFSIYRYAVIYEVISVIFLVAFICKHLKNEQSKKILLFILFFFLWHPEPKDFFDYREYKDKECFITVEKVNLPDNTLVKIYGMKNSYVIPEFAKNNNFRSVAHYRKCNDKNKCFFGRGADLSEHGEFYKIRDKIEKEHMGTEVILYDNGSFTPEDTVRKIADTEHNFYKQCVIKKLKNKLTPNTDCYALFLQVEEYDLNLLENTKNKYCRELKTNLNNGGGSSTFICVPPELKDQILSAD